MFRFLFVLPVPLDRPHRGMSVVSNYLSLQHGEWHTSNGHYFILLKQFIHAGLGHIDQALPAFSVCVDWLWMGGWKWQNLTNHSRVISFCERGWTESSPTVRAAVCSACGNVTDFPVLVFLCLFLLFPPVLIVFSILNLSLWCRLSPFHLFPPPLSCISFSYSFSFHPSLWDNIHRTC